MSFAPTPQPNQPGVPGTGQQFSPPSGDGAGSPPAPVQASPPPGFPRPIDSPPPEPVPAPGFPPPGQEFPPAPGTPPGAPAPPADLRALLAQQGIDISRWSDESQFARDLAAHLQHQSQMSQELDASRNLLQQYAAWAAQQQQAAQQPAPEAQAPEAETPYWPQAPEWDPAWERYLQPDPDDPNKINELRPGVLAKYDQYVKWKTDVVDRLARDPWGALDQPYRRDRDALKQEVLQEAEKKFEEKLETQRQQQLVNSLVLANQHLLYQQDPQSGQPVFNPQTGQPVFTPQGMQFAQTIQQLEAAGLTDPGMQWQLAFGAVFGNQPPPQQQQADPLAGPPPASPPGFPPPGGPILPPNPREAANEAFLQQAAQAYAANRSGSVTAGDQPGGPGQHGQPSIDQAFDRALQTGGRPL